MSDRCLVLRERVSIKRCRETIRLGSEGARPCQLAETTAWGALSVEIEIVNNADLIRLQDGHLPADQVRRERIKAVVDSGAMKLACPWG